MKIVTWNINGLRSLKKSVSAILQELDADVVCLQETKISRFSLPEEMALIEGYSSYFTFSKKQCGYSGVATYCKESFTPEHAEEGLSGILAAENKAASILNKEVPLNEFVLPSELHDIDSEGRVVITYHKIRCGSNIQKLAIINTYCPRVDPEKPDRHIYKMKFCHLLSFKAKELSQENWFVIVVGDLNIAHNVIDHCDPGDVETFAASDSRQWLSLFLTPCGNSCSGTDFYDVFRYLYPTKREAYTCWNTRTGARETNYGTRIDYILVSCTLLPNTISCQILSHVQGSDHCPVSAIFDVSTLASTKQPSLCTRFYPEFAGKQQKLNKFLQEHPPIISSKEKFECTELSETEIVKKQKTQAKSYSEVNKQKSIADFFTKDQKKQNKSIQNSKTVVESEFYESTKKIKNIDKEPADDHFMSKVRDLNTDQTEKWKCLLSGPPKPPLCKGHNKSCVVRTVKKSGLNFGRQFFACPQPDGPSSNPESKCNFFQWVVKNRKT